MYKLNQAVPITLTRLEPGFDRASDTAYSIALDKFEFDESGNCDNVEGFHRSNHVLEVKFISYRRIGSMAGQHHIYEFSAEVK